MTKLGVTESYKLKKQVVSSASEASEMVLRVYVNLLSHFSSSAFESFRDNVLRAAPRKREGRH